MAKEGTSGWLGMAGSRVSGFQPAPDGPAMVLIDVARSVPLAAAQVDPYQHSALVTAARVVTPARHGRAIHPGIGTFCQRLLPQICSPLPANPATSTYGSMAVSARSHRPAVLREDHDHTPMAQAKSPAPCYKLPQPATLIRPARLFWIIPEPPLAATKAVAIHPHLPNPRILHGPSNLPPTPNRLAPRIRASRRPLGPFFA